MNTETVQAGGAYSTLRDAERKASRFYKKAKAMLKYDGVSEEEP